jgi:hypothetical protein
VGAWAYTTFNNFFRAGLFDEIQARRERKRVVELVCGEGGGGNDIMA